MDEEEIDVWYEEAKQKSLDEYMLEIEQSKNHEDAEKKYNLKLSRIIERYNKLMNDLIDKKSKMLRKK